MGQKKNKQTVNNIFILPKDFYERFQQQIHIKLCRLEYTTIRMAGSDTITFQPTKVFPRVDQNWRNSCTPIISYHQELYFTIVNRNRFTSVLLLMRKTDL